VTKNWTVATYQPDRTASSFCSSHFNVKLTMLNFFDLAAYQSSDTKRHHMSNSVRNCLSRIFLQTSWCQHHQKCQIWMSLIAVFAWQMFQMSVAWQQNATCQQWQILPDRCRVLLPPTPLVNASFPSVGLYELKDEPAWHYQSGKTCLSEVNMSNTSFRLILLVIDVACTAGGMYWC